MLHKFDRQLFGMDVRGMRISYQNGTEHGYNLDERVIFNFGRSFYKLIFVRAKATVVRLQAAL